MCGGKGPKWPVECHEIWEYDDTNHVQKLLGLIALCPPCHSVKHIGYAQIAGNYASAFNHLRQVNGLSLEEAQAYVEASFEIWSQRSKHNWKLDISWLTERGITVSPVDRR